MLNSLLIPKRKSHPNKKINSLLTAFTFAVSLTLGGCASSNISGTKDTKVSSGAQNSRQSAIVEFADIPMPKRREINLAKTMVVGTKVWYGRVTFDTGETAENIFVFYNRELTNYGWSKINAVRSQTSLLTYEREGRVINIAITPNQFLGSEVKITMSPKEKSISPSALPTAIMRAPISPPPAPR